MNRPTSGHSRPAASSLYLPSGPALVGDREGGGLVSTGYGIHYNL